jgi:hypothetical protein
MNNAATQTLLLLALAVSLLPLASALPTATTSYASNWSGYVATSPGPYTFVSASWTIPSVSTTSPPAYSSLWVGVGGWYSNSNRLIQVGTDQDVLDNGSAVYYAWRELYPNLAVPVGNVSPGDMITATVSQVSANSSAWRMLMVRNSATLLNMTIRARVNLASENTADFIVERPAIAVGRRDQLTTLANFKNVIFSNCNTNQGTLASLSSVAEVVMRVGNATSISEYLAEPTTLSQSTSSFSVQYAGTLESVAEFPSYLIIVVVIVILTLGAPKLISKHDTNRPKAA